MPKHNWVRNEKEVSLYDTTYQCTICKKWHTVSIDSIESSLPEDGCIRKPPSYLQRLNSLTNWCIYFLLHEFPMRHANELESSRYTLNAINEYNSAVKKLKVELRQDYLSKRYAIKSSKREQNNS